MLRIPGGGATLQYLGAWQGYGHLLVLTSKLEVKK